MVGWHHQLNGHEFEHATKDGEGQGSLACCSPWAFQESDNLEAEQQHSGHETMNRHYKPKIYMTMIYCTNSLGQWFSKYGPGP